MKNDSQLILETMERTRKMIEERSVEVKKSFLEEVTEDLESKKPSKFFENLFLVVLALNIMGYLGIPLYVFAVILLLPLTISLLTISTYRLQDFVDDFRIKRRLKKIAKRNSQRTCYCESCKCETEK